jgi:hypothetical protein
MSDRSPQSIEAELEQERAALAQALAGLRDRLAPAALFAQGRAALAAEARPILSPLLAEVDRAIRSQPLVAAAAGVALAALILGRKRDEPEVAPVPVMAGTRYEALTRWEDEGGPVAAAPPDPEDEWLAEATAIRARADTLLARIDEAARRGLAPAADLARHRAEILAALARDTRTALARGLGSVSGAAREQAIVARERVYLSRLALGSGSRQTVGEHPLAAGAAMVAAGAALALLFRPTETEDRLMGGTRDRLMAEAKDALRAEAVKASELARCLTDALGHDIGRARRVFQPPAAPRPADPQPWPGHRH